MSRAFGPTYAGEDLRYPGVWFSFDEDGIARRENASLQGGHERSPQREDKTQEVKRVIVSQKSLSDEENDVLSEVQECPVMHGDIKEVVIKVRLCLEHIVSDICI